ncbi:MAG: hypothetical protein K0R17_1971 [Rariglobus sp.]|jgi:hypothetical protein|nr:hypothetical protein [Rariglobus sp.]
MNMPNAFGFIFAGLVMEGLHFLPGISGVRELWLLVMGGVLTSIGVGVVAQGAWLQVAPRVQALSQAVAARRRAVIGVPSDVAAPGRRVSA